MLHIHMDAAQKWGPDYRPRAEKIVSSSFSHSIDCVVICVCVCVCVCVLESLCAIQASTWMDVCTELSIMFMRGRSCICVSVWLLAAVPSAVNLS